MSVEILARPHPLRSDLYRCVVPLGTSLADIFGEPIDCLQAQVNGEPWPLERWAEPLPEGLINLTTVPHGNVGRVIGMIAVAALAAWTGGAATAWAGSSGGLGLSATAAKGVGAAAAAAVTVAGSLALNALIPPKMPSSEPPPSSNIRGSLTGTQNNAVPYGVVPRVYGEPRWYPPLAASPVTEVQGNDQYMRLLFCLGYGPLQIGGQTASSSSTLTHLSGLPAGTIKIGETSIEQYQGVEYQIGTANNLTLFSQNIHEEGVAVAMDYVSENLGKGTHADNVEAVRTTAPNCREIVVDLTAPAGLFGIDKTSGKKRPVHVQFKIDYRPTGSGTWLSAVAAHNISGPVLETLRRSYRWAVSSGQYDVRVTRIQTSFSDDLGSIAADFTWTALRSVQEGSPYTNNNHILLALRIKASDQLNGVVQQLSIRTKSILRTWNGSTFTEAATSNPAWHFLDALTGAQVARPVADSKIDLAALKDWADWCDTQGLHYHWVHDQQQTIFERLREICAAGQASFGVQDGLFTVIRDDPNAPVVQVISPRNARNFESSRQYKSLPHGLRVKYIDPATWTDAERIIYRDGYSVANATIFEDFETQGVASADEAWHHGHYFFRQAILRPETFSVEMDWEHLACRRGNRVRLAYDAIMVGLGWGRVKNIVADGNGDATRIDLDEMVVMEAGKSYGLRVRKQDGTHAVFEVLSSLIGQTNQLHPIAPQADINVGDLVLFGELGRESIDCKVREIRPGADFTATLMLVNAATDIYDYDSPPVYDPGITRATPLHLIAPPAPVITALRGDESALVRDTDGSLRVALRASYTFTVALGLPTMEVEARYRVVGTEQWATAGPVAASGDITMMDVEVGLTYEVQVRAVNGGVHSAWSAASTALVSGKTNPPNDVTGFVARQNGPNAVFRWDQETSLDLKGYVLKYQSQNAPFDWALAKELTSVTRGTQVTSAMLPPGVWWVGIKAVDTSGNESVNAATAVVRIVNRNNAVFSSNEGPAWAGDIDGFVVSGGNLVLDPDLADDGVATYTSPFLDAGFIDIVRAWGDVQATAPPGASPDPKMELRYSLGSDDDALMWDHDKDGDVDEDDDDALMWGGSQLDPMWDAWSEWFAWTVGEVNARIIQMRILRPKADGDITISQFTPVVDVPPQWQSKKNVSIEAGGSTVFFDKPFHAVPVVTANVTNGAALAAITNTTTTNFTVIVYDTNGVSGPALINYTATTE